MSNQIDSVDLTILSHLKNNGRMPITRLAEKIGISRQTIANRLKRLTHDGRVIIKGGLDLMKLGFKMASVGLEVKNEATRRDVEKYLKNCPRVLTIFRTPEKANIHIDVWGEDDQTINSTVESFRDLENVEVVYNHYLGHLIHGDIIIGVNSNQQDVSPCGRSCNDCYRYNNSWCVGCPVTFDYKNPLLTSK
ncbi:MAG: AsnC family transcriptional regulator [Candidatus Bathyarchaeota archaeon]|nr:MAG: AsnC family transcriptional regulator [Candidatus Bathyarchaeota archaeon]